ncbi:tyrosine-type recombinase/integrase [Streptomyces nojiriensis]|uniref:tyrosine-type recombinase/integrase n=1 Tax=Streptomyces nojiriensis TaxID=66374 RepID=UPI0036538659
MYSEFITAGDRANGSRYQYETSLRLHVEPYFSGTAIGAAAHRRSVCRDAPAVRIRGGADLRGPSGHAGRRERGAKSRCSEGDYERSETGPLRKAPLLERRGHQLMYSLVDRLWRRAKQSAGITRKITPHWLRHFFASAGLSKGVPVTDMAEWLGHRDPCITHETYVHVMPDAPGLLRALMDSVFTRETELSLPLELEAVVQEA